MLFRLAVGTLFLVMALGVAGVIAVGLRSQLLQIMPLPLRVLSRAAGLIVAGLLVSILLLFAVIAFSGSGIGDPCPPYCGTR